MPRQLCEPRARLTKEICEDCGKLFMAGKDAYLCPKCRKNRLSEYAKHRKLSELGTAARWGKKKEALKDGKSD